MKGKDLEYKEYEPLFACAAEVVEKQHKKGIYITCDDYVTMTDGTGIVHIAPAFGEDDANVSAANMTCPSSSSWTKGRMTGGTPFAGMRCKHKEGMDAISADPEILKDLEERTSVLRAEVRA